MRNAAQQAGWGLGDQALSSITNFMLAILVARTVGGEDFGAFSLAFATYVLALGACRALASEPLAVRYSARDAATWRQGAALAVGAAALLGGFVGLGCALTGLAAGGAFGNAMVPIGAAMPGLLMQDTWRFAFFAVGRGASAFLNDLAWALMLVAAVSILLVGNDASVGSLTLAWGGTATAAAFLGAVQARIAPRPLKAYRWWSNEKDLAPRFLAEFVVTTGASQAALYGIAVVGGFAAAGALRAADILLAPYRVVLTAVGLFAVPHTVRLLRVSPAKLLNRCALVSFSLASVSCAIGIAIYLLPQPLGTALLGSLWSDAHEIILLLAVSTAGLGTTMGALVGLRALAAATRSLRARLLAGPLIVIAPVTGAFLEGAPGAAAGFATAFTFGAAACWWQLLAAIRERREEPAPASLGALAVAPEGGAQP